MFVTLLIVACLVFGLFVWFRHLARLLLAKFGVGPYTPEGRARRAALEQRRLFGDGGSLERGGAIGRVNQEPEYSPTYSYDHNSFLCGRCGSPMATANSNIARGMGGMCNRCGEELRAAALARQQGQAWRAGEQHREREALETVGREAEERAEQQTDWSAAEWQIYRKDEPYDRGAVYASFLHRARVDRGLSSEPPVVEQSICAACSKSFPAALAGC